MTIQKLSAASHSSSSTSSIGYAYSSLKDSSSIAHINTQIHPRHALIQELHQNDLARIDPVSRIGQIYKRHSDLSRALEKKETKPWSFLDKLLHEATDAIKDNFKRLLEEGDLSFSQNHLNAAEKQYADALKVISGKDDRQEVTCSQKLGIVYLERAKRDGPNEDRKEDCIRAAGLLNYALLVATKNKNENLQRNIREKLMEVQSVLCSLCSLPEVANRGAFWDEENRQLLNGIREKFKNRDISLLTGPENVKELFREITLEMKAFVLRLIDQSKKILGEPPLNSNFAVIGLGSMAREEMTPFSDLEFAILIEEGKDIDEVREYFRNLTHLLHLRVLTLGETILPALGIKSLEGFTDKTTPRGFAFDGKGCPDKGHKTPLGKKEVFELIQTPTKMAEFQGKTVKITGMRRSRLYRWSCIMSPSFMGKRFS